MASKNSSARPRREAPLVFALDTATPVCSLALLRGGEPLFSRSFIPPGGHSTELMPAVDSMVRETGTPASSWDAVVVSRGPGSFTGLRIGLATAKALCLGLGIPLYGVSTLEALALRLTGSGARYICPLIDARKGQVFAALYRPSRSGLSEVVGPTAIEPSGLPVVFPREALFTGNGLERYARELRAAYGASLRAAPPGLRVPDAATGARLGLPRVIAREPSELESLVPLYVRQSDAEIHYGRPRATCRSG